MSRIFAIALLLLVASFSVEAQRTESLTASNSWQNFHAGAGRHAGYSANEDVNYVITAKSGEVVRLSFTVFSTEESNDWVEVFDGGALVSARLSGHYDPNSLAFEASSGTMKVRFVTDGSVTGAGFHAKYISAPAGARSCSTNSECAAHASCVRGLCICDGGFSGNGASCTDINECLNTPCSDGKTCSNTVGSYTCACPTGYWGDGGGTKHKEKEGRRGCWDINECFLNTDNCHANARCSNTAGSFECKCKEGYTGDGVTCRSAVSACHHELVASATPATLSSNPNSFRYDNNMDCVWNITASKNQIIKLNFLTFFTERWYDLVTVFDASGDLTDGPLHGTERVSRLPTYEASGWLAIRFTSDYSVKTFGFTAKYSSELVVGTCATACHPSANCEENSGVYSCVCQTGYTGSGVSCSDVNECVGSNNCHANAQCTNTLGSYTCACKAGYEGNGVTCDDINECESGVSPCSTHAVCLNSAGSFSCQCSAGFSGNAFVAGGCVDINECSAGTPCGSAPATCTNVVGFYSCGCQAGYGGSPCANINECASAASNNCHEHATCTDTTGSFTCTCNAGYSGSGTSCAPADCSTFLVSTPCALGAECVIKSAGPECVCLPGFEGDGDTCSDIDECAGGLCGVNAVCVNTVGDYTCSCRSGFVLVGSSCVDIDECSAGSDNCDANAACINTDGSFSCVCNSGYDGVEGTSCIDIDECQSLCDGVGQRCANTPGSYTCECRAGYTQGGIFPAITCSANPCTAFGTCSVTASGSTCTQSCPSGSQGAPTTHFCLASVWDTTTGPTCTACATGYTGVGCAVDIDECAAGSDTCDASATCTNTVGSYACACNAGYIGSGTECADVNECDSLCNNVGQVCANTPGSYTCGCDAGYTLGGVFPAITCSANPCPAFDTCSGTASGSSCSQSCPAGFYDATTTHNCFAGAWDTTTGPSCRACDAGYAGVNCADDIHECDLGTHNCDVNAACSNIVGSFTCACNAGYSGVGTAGSCVANPCAAIGNPAAGTSTCTGEAVAHEGTCVLTCNPGYAGGSVTRTCTLGAWSAESISCTNIDECDLGTDNCDDHATCSDTDGSFTCACNSGYVGDGTTDGPCSPVPCGPVDSTETVDSSCSGSSVPNGGVCTLTCRAGYEGGEASVTRVCTLGTWSAEALDCVNVDECDAAPGPCNANAACSDTAGSFTCACNSGYTGDGTTCSPNPCDPIGSTGTFDSTCSGSPVANGGSCTLSCPSGYEGAPVTQTCSLGSWTSGAPICTAIVASAPTANNFALTVAEDSGLASGNSMSGNAGRGGPCRDASGCKFMVTGCTADVACSLSVVRNVHLPYGFFDSDFKGVTLLYSDNGDFSVNPRANFYGTVEFKFKTLENGLSSAEATVTITVSGVADSVGTNGCTFFISPGFSAPGSGVTFIGPNFADATKMAPSTWTGDGPGGVVIKADAFKDWRTGGGKLWFAAAGTGNTQTFRWKKLMTNSWSTGCIGAASVSECFYPDAACVRVSHSVYQMTADLSACKTTVWGKVSVEAWASEDPTWGRNHKIYLETQNSVAVVEFTLAHSITGWLDNLPLTIWFAPPVAPAGMLDGGAGATAAAETEEEKAARMANIQEIAGGLGAALIVLAAVGVAGFFIRRRLANTADTTGFEKVGEEEPKRAIGFAGGADAERF